MEMYDDVMAVSEWQSGSSQNHKSLSNVAFLKASPSVIYHCPFKGQSLSHTFTENQAISCRLSTGLSENTPENERDKAA